MKIDKKILLLRKLMDKHEVNACIFPSADPHQSEYISSHWAYREWISGFTGSAGLAIITQNHSGIWTDSRYFLQAEKELSTSEFELHKMYNQFGNDHYNWLLDKLEEGQTIGINGKMFSELQVKNLLNKLKSKNIKLDVQHDFIKTIWTNQPEFCTDQIFEHALKYTGKSRNEKLHDIRQVMQDHDADHHLVTTLDDIAWILNLRGNDVNFNPVFVSYLLISKESTKLFVSPSKLSEALSRELNSQKIFILPYDQISQSLNELPKSERLLVDPAQCNHYVYRAINCEKVEFTTISRLQKAIKNDIEIEHIKDAHVKDGVVLTRFYIWLENELSQGKTVSEYAAGKKIAHFRSQQEGYFGESFSAIVGYGPNGAIVHYRAQKESCLQIKRGQMLLIDSGGQYLHGTTDITRTIHTGTPSAKEKDVYTRVLKGHIGLASAKFPKGTMGGQLDILARQHLWNAGLNFLHGTGHGVGFFLNVHEPPQGFAPNLTSRSGTKQIPGMLTSNEPGYYEDHGFGIRIENLILTIESKHKDFYEFETISYFPISTKLILRDLMTKKERDWLNKYHQMVLNRLSPKLGKSEQDWLKKKCAAL